MKPTRSDQHGARELVDEAALADAIKEKRIGGAAIDVFRRRALPRTRRSGRSIA